MRDRRAGDYGFCNPRESYFIPRGEAPRDEIRIPRVSKNHMPPNRQSRNSIALEFTKLEKSLVVAKVIWFHEKNVKVTRNCFAIARFLRQIDYVAGVQNFCTP